MKKVDYFIVLLLVVFLLLRLPLLFTSEKSLEGDSASIAVMAMNTFRHGEFHYFIYGEPYVGAAALNAYLAIVPFSLFGVSDISFKLLSVMFALASAAVTFLFVKKYFGKRAGYLAAIIMAITPFFFTRLSVLGMSGYMETLTYLILLTWLFYIIFLEERNQARNMALFGIIAGIAWWISEYVIAFLLFFVFFWYLMDKRFFTRKLFWIFVASILVALSPLIYYNLTHNFDNIRHFLAGTVVHKFACDNGLFPEAVAYQGRQIDPCAIFKEEIHGTFTLSGFFTETLLQIFGNWPYYLLAVSLMALIIYYNRNSIIPAIKSLIPLSKYNLDIKKHGKELFILCFFTFWFFIYLASGRSDPKHFSPIFPFVAILLAIAISRLKNFIISLLVLTALLTSAVIPNMQAIFMDDKQDISPLMEFYRANGLYYLYTDHPTKWQILFYGNEQIIASCNICPCVNQYPKIEEKMMNTKDTAYTFALGSTISEKLMEHLNKSSIQYDTAVIGRKIVVYNMSSAIDPLVLAPCNWLDEQKPRMD